jgi:hypothetical protein
MRSVKNVSYVAILSLHSEESIIAVHVGVSSTQNALPSSRGRDLGYRAHYVCAKRVYTL